MLPAQTEYQTALQNPHICLQDLKYKTYKVETDQMGFPKVRSGGFALTYKLINQSDQVAVRCFHKYSPNLENRYKAINKFLNENRKSFFVPVIYDPAGIRINSQLFPVTYMEWIKGETLSQFVLNNHTNPVLINKILKELISVIKELELLKVAHGDLSNLNIMVRNEQIILIDYDGMFVPELSGQKSAELGNPNFQHPYRTDRNFDQKLDRFSEFVLYLALSGIVNNPRLYGEFGAGCEGLLFRKSDFLNPETSLLLRKLEKIGELSNVVRLFRSICHTNLESIPSLEAGLGKTSVILPSVEPPTALSSTDHSYRVYSTENCGQLIELDGEFVTLIGLCEATHSSTSKRNEPYVFLNFGDFRRQCFTATIWYDSLKQFDKLSIDPKKYREKYLSITGTISLFSNSYGIRPQINIESPDQIEVIDEKIAHERLSTLVKDRKVMVTVKNHADSVTSKMSKSEEILNKLYGNSGSPKSSYGIPNLQTKRQVQTQSPGTTLKHPRDNKSDPSVGTKISELYQNYRPVDKKINQSKKESVFRRIFKKFFKL